MQMAAGVYSYVPKGIAHSVIILHTVLPLNSVFCNMDPRTHGCVRSIHQCNLVCIVVNVEAAICAIMIYCGNLSSPGSDPADGVADSLRRFRSLP
jgi:hypothetical protein